MWCIVVEAQGNVVNELNNFRTQVNLYRVACIRQYWGYFIHMAGEQSKASSIQVLVNKKKQKIDKQNKDLLYLK